jgi:hypothetical protein
VYFGGKEYSRDTHEGLGSKESGCTEGQMGRSPGDGQGVREESPPGGRAVPIDRYFWDRNTFIGWIIHG